MHCGSVIFTPPSHGPKPKQQAPKIPTLREFTKQFFAYVEVQKKSGTARFYRVCSNRVLRFSALADALVTEIRARPGGASMPTGGKSTSPEDSVPGANGELRANSGGC